MMGYYQVYQKYKNLPWKKFFADLLPSNINRAIQARYLDERQFLSLLSPLAQDYLEEMAQKAHNLTLAHFGRAVQLYTPLYLSNYCENQCAYCGFNRKNDIPRRKLSLEEAQKEAALISESGLKHILILTGDSRREAPLGYVVECVKVLKEYFSSISIEIYALSEKEYAQISSQGVDGLTLYQETYDQRVYADMHPKGPKRDYLFRLDAPERAAKARLRNVNIGVLLGLDDWRREVFFLGLHARYLQDKFPDLEVGVSLPRFRPYSGDFKIPSIVSDKNIAQAIMALRIFLPRLAVALSTRESQKLRENLLPLGITRMSAGSSTMVGGRITEADQAKGPPQFEIADTRSVEEIKAMLLRKGCQPVLKDWMQF